MPLQLSDRLGPRKHPTRTVTRLCPQKRVGEVAAGQSVEQVLDGYPYLEREDILAALAFAAESIQSERPFAAA